MDTRSSVIHLSDGVVDLSGSDSASPSYPVLIKPTTDGSSKGMDNSNKVNEPTGFRLALNEDLNFQIKISSWNYFYLAVNLQSAT